MLKRMIVVVAGMLLLAGCGTVGDPVAYETVKLGQLPAKVAGVRSPGSTGISEVRGYTYAFVTPEAGQMAEILSVEKAKVGFDVIYRIVAVEGSLPETKVVKVRNLFSVPVGFKRVD